jgi:bifunctional non-homologous end joining protein LigD
VFDGEIVALDEDGRPAFNDLLFGRREPSYVAFDVLFVDGQDVRGLPLKERRALLEKVVRAIRPAEVRARAGRRQCGVPGGVRARP